MAPFALLSWPFASLLLAIWLGPKRGLIVSFLTGFLFLPEKYGWDLPGLPPYSKTTAVGVGCMICLAVAHLQKRDLPTGRAVEDKLPARVMMVLLGIFIVAAIPTVLTNRDAINFEIRSIPGLGFRDLVAIISQMVILTLPYFAARTLLVSEDDHRRLAYAIVIAGLIYSFLILVEVRLSPQLHTWVYGYFQHVWSQHERGGGYRPIVFLRHGTHVGFFIFAVLVCALALTKSRDEGRRRNLYFIGGMGFFVILIMSRNFGAALLALIFVPVLLLTGKRVQYFVLSAIAIIMLVMPIIQHTGVVPRDGMVQAAKSIAPERGESLAFRFRQEERIMERVAERPVFGWGPWARWRIHDARGRELSVVDALWISIYGEHGYFGYIGFFGLLTAPLLLLPRAARRYGVGMPTLGLAMILGGNLVYMFANPAGNPMTWFVVGCLAGYLRFAARHSEGTVSNVAEPPDRKPRYARFGPQSHDVSSASTSRAQAGQTRAAPGLRRSDLHS